MNPTEHSESIRDEVRRHYARIASAQEGGCCAASCCTPAPGYSDEERDSPEALGNLGLGCGNPGMIASIASGDTVVDLGSGAGFDCFLAARRAGAGGRVIGVDMTAEMIERARANAAKLGLSNTEFVQGRIEELPLPDGAADVVISNCVVNLSPEKPRVFAEAYRVLRAGGRLAIADVVAVRPMPPELARDSAAYCACVAGAASVDETRAHLAAAGFVDVSIELSSQTEGVDGAEYVRAALIAARKPWRAG